ncbi:MAG TPA: TonB-dependent receptor [Caulobacterales bacterium]|nr:TonB-dependent receptor [Caulobacterales bacterium]
MKSRIWAQASLTCLTLAALPMASAWAQSGASEEIVVTATGRLAALQDVPIAVTALSGQALENAGIHDLRQIEQLAPSYHFQTGQSNTAGTTAYVRGLGTAGDNPGFESAVGFFVDGVYRNRSGVALSDLPEVQRIEVLRGPQGTLFGRNTSAGAISVVTAKPQFTQRTTGEMTYGERNLLSGKLGLTGPLFGDSVAGRLDVAGTVQDGYIRDSVSGRDINNRDRANARGQLLFNFSDNVSFRLIADVAKTNEECCGAVTVLAGPTAAALNLIRPGAIITPPNPEARTQSISPGRGYGERVNERGISGELDWDIGNANLTSITAYRNWRARRSQDIDFTSVDRTYRDGYRLGFDTFTQELRLQGQAGRLDWLIGGFYANEKLDLTDRVQLGSQAAQYVDIVSVGNTGTLVPGGAQFFGTAGPQLFSQIASPFFKPNLIGAIYLQSQGVSFGTANALQRGTYDAIAGAFAASAPVAGNGQNSDVWGTDTESWAAFTHNQIALTDKLNLTLGARMNFEKKDLTANLNSVMPACATLRSASILPLVQGAVALAGPAALQLATLVCNPAFNTLQNGAFAKSTDENKWNGVASLSYKAAPNLMTFATASRGYKAGGFNLDRSSFNILPTTTVQRPITDLQFRPEFVNNYELGFKWSPMARTTVNGTAYYEDIEDYQVNAFTGFNFATFNVPAAVSRGFELESSWRPTDSFTLATGAVFNEAFLDSPVTVGTETLAAGTRLAHAPKWVATGSATYQHSMGGGLTGLIYVDGRWNSRYKTQIIGRNPITDNSAYAVFNARFGVSHEAGWSIEAFVNNLTDEFYYLHGFPPPEQTGTFAIYPSAPRTWGVSLKADF